MGEQDKVPEALWDYIKYLREKNNLTIKQFSKKIKCSEYHARSIEKDFREVGRTTSVELIKKIAKVCSEDEEERKQIEYKLTVRRARIHFSKEVVESSLMGLTAESFIAADAMPTAFIERLKADIAHLEDKNIINKLSITRLALDSVLAGKYHLSKRKVSEIAKRFKQSEYEYLLLASYVPDALYRIVNNKHFEHFIHRSESLKDNDIDKMGIVLTNMLSLIVPPDKKKEG